jgi:hypothetical protein
MSLVGNRKIGPTHAEVECETAAYLPVVFDEDARLVLVVHVAQALGKCLVVFEGSEVRWVLHEAELGDAA